MPAEKHAQSNAIKKPRCPWAKGDLDRAYHDAEWGVPTYDDRVLFEFLILEGAQAGLSWTTILKKRENYRTAFDGFDAEKVARFTQRRIERILSNTNPATTIVRNRLKVESAIRNARAFLDIQSAHDAPNTSRARKPTRGFARYIWSFVDGEPITNHWRTQQDVPATTPIADAMSKDLKQRGFNFVGPTICYAFMQATGMVNDHLTSCHRHRELFSQS